MRLSKQNIVHGGTGARVSNRTEVRHGKSFTVEEMSELGFEKRQVMKTKGRAFPERLTVHAKEHQQEAE